MFKRTLTLFLALMMVLGLSGQAMAAQPAAQNTDLSLGETTWLTSAAFFKDQILLSGDGIYTYQPGDEELTQLQSFSTPEWTEKYPDIYGLTLVADGDSLYGLHLEKDMLYPITINEGGKGIMLGEGIQLDLSPLLNMEYGDEGYKEQPSQLLAHGGRLYMVLRTYGPKGPTAKLLSYDVAAGGQATEHKAEFVAQIAPYKDGKLLAMVMNEAEAWDPKTNQMKPPMLAVYDPAADALTELGTAGVPYRSEGMGMVYDAQGDYVYLTGKDEVYRWTQANGPELCAYLPPTNYGGAMSGRLLMIAPGRIAAVNQQGVSVRGTDPAQLPTGRLTIYGSYMDDNHKAAIQGLNGIPVTFLDNKYFSTAQELGQALVSGEDNIDILFLRSDSIDLDNIIAKGYCADLSGSQVITDYVAKTYPMMQEQAMREGKTYLVPVDLDGQLVVYFPKLLEQVGVEVPKTFDQLCDFLQQWNDELGEKFPDILPMQSTDYRNELMQMAMTLFADSKGIKGEEFTFADPQLKDLLTRATTVNTEDIAQKVDWSQPGSNAAMEEIYNKPPVIENRYGLSLDMLSNSFNNPDGQMTVSYGNGPGYEVGTEQPFQLSMSQAEKPVTGVTLTLMAVNPKSKNLESAIRYVEQYVSGLQPVKAAMLNPELNDPIPNPYFERSIKWMEERKANMERELAKLEGAEKTEMQANYEREMAENEKNMERMRWQVVPEAIAYYRQMMDNAYVRTFNAMSTIWQSPDIRTLFERYTQGQLPLEQFLQEADGKLRLMRLESR